MNRDDEIRNYGMVRYGDYLAAKFSAEGDWSVRREPCTYSQILSVPHWWDRGMVEILLHAMCAAHARGAESARREIREALGVTE